MMFHLEGRFTIYFQNSDIMFHHSLSLGKHAFIVSDY